jgi:hypothetical protein
MGRRTSVVEWHTGDSMTGSSESDCSGRVGNGSEEIKGWFTFWDQFSWPLLCPLIGQDHDGNGE